MEPLSNSYLLCVLFLIILAGFYLWAFTIAVFLSAAAAVFTGIARLVKRKWENKKGRLSKKDRLPEAGKDGQ